MASIRQMSMQVSRGSPGDYHADEQAGVTGLSWRVSGSAMQETWVRSLGWEDPLEKDMATRSSIVTWRIPWTEEPGGLQPTVSQRVGHD